MARIRNESNRYWSKEDKYKIVLKVIDDIVYDNNYLRPSYALNYKTPIEYKTQLGFK